MLTVFCHKAQISIVREKLIAILSGPKLYLLEVHASDTEVNQTKLEARYIYDGRDYVKQNENITHEISLLFGVKTTEWMFKE